MILLKGDIALVAEIDYKDRLCPLQKGEKMYNKFGIKKEIMELASKIKPKLEGIYDKVDEVAEYNSLKVLSAFQKFNLSEMHFRRNNRIWI